LLIVVAAMTTLAALSWRTWADPITDFGREIYAAWRVSEGAVLHRDLSWYFGPLSVHFNALLFKLAGTSLATLIWINLGIFAVATLLLHRILVRISDRLCAFLGCLVLVVVSGFIQLVATGNYNWITPYNHDLTHGVALSLGSILALGKWLETRRRGFLCVSGVCLGMVALTKPELLVACAGSVLPVLAQDMWLRQLRPRQAWVEAWRFGACALAAPLAAWVALRFVLDASGALRAVLGGWYWLARGDATAFPLYAMTRGTDDTFASLRAIGAMALRNAAWLAPAVLVGWIMRRKGAHRLLGSALVAGVLGGTGLVLMKLIYWPDLYRGFSLWVPLVCGFVLLRALQERTGTSSAEQLLRAAFAIFATLLCAKIALRFVVYHYGFIHAPPGVVLVLCATGCWLPAWVERRGGSGHPLRFTTVVLAGLICASVLEPWRLRFREKPSTLGDGADLVHTDPRGASAELALRQIFDPPDRRATLAVLPEGVFFNYVSRRINPTPFVDSLAWTIALHGEDAILRAYESNPPDYLFIVVAHRADEYGVQTFGVDYGSKLAAWVLEHYTDVTREAHPRFPIRVLRRH
jgi:hypothetical protein